MVARKNTGKIMAGEKNPQVAERWAAAVRLRASGMGYADIARQLGYANAGGAHDAVRDGLRMSLRSAGSEDLRAIEAERLDRMQKGVWKRATSSHQVLDKNGVAVEVGPDPEAIAVLLKIMDRRAKLLGLDAPVKLQHSGNPDNPVVVKVIKGVSMDEIGPES